MLRIILKKNLNFENSYNFIFKSKKDGAIGIQALTNDNNVYFGVLDEEQTLEFYEYLGHLIEVKKPTETEQKIDYNQIVNKLNEILNRISMIEKEIALTAILDKKINSIECEIHKLKYVVLSMHEELIDRNNK
jgi:hypothetical protein